MIHIVFLMDHYNFMNECSTDFCYPSWMCNTGYTNIFKCLSIAMIVAYEEVKVVTCA